MIFVVYIKEKNNYMKKSKIIVPALGIICLSTAASITGTVAWFTASRSATITAGDFAVTKTTNNLSVVLTAGAGTSVSGSAVSMLSGYKLTDASFDHLTGRVYNPDEEGEKIKEFFDVSAAKTDSKNVRSSTDHVLSVATWNMAVTVEFGSVSGNVALYLKTKGDDSSVVTVKNNETPKTAKGFRMAFIPSATADETNGATRRVWADLQTETQTVEQVTTTLIKHVNSITDNTHEDAINGVAYTDHYLIDSAYSADLPEDSGDNAINQTTAAARPDYLGTFTWAENTRVTLNYTVVCWYEGTDPEVVNRSLKADYQTVSSKIVLAAVKLAA